MSAFAPIDVYCSASGDRIQPGFEVPSDVKAIDLPNDAGEGLLVSWRVSPDDTPDAKPRKVVKYEILRKKQGEQSFQLVDEKPYQSTSFEDTNCELGESYFYQIVAVAPDGSKSSPVASADPAKTVMQYFDESKAWFGVLLVMVLVVLRPRALLVGCNT